MRLLLLFAICLLVSCTEIIEPDSQLQIIDDVVSPNSESEIEITSTNSHTTTLGLAQFNLQLEMGLNTTITSQEKAKYRLAVSNIRNSLIAIAKNEMSSSEVKVETINGNLKKNITIPYTKTIYRLINRNGGNETNIIIFDGNWQKRKIPSPNALVMDYFDEYRFVSLVFAAGTALFPHESTLAASNTSTTYRDVSDALQNGIIGLIWIGSAPGYSNRPSSDIPAQSLWSGISSGRIALIDGEVTEHVSINNSQIQAVPVTFSNYTMTLNFHTEDYRDFDYNDSYVRASLTREVSSNSSLGLIPNQIFSVREGVQTNTSFGYLYSYHQNPITAYSIIEGNESNRFAILFDGTNALLYTAGVINYDEQSRYELAVQVTDDQSNSSTGVIFINVEQVTLSNIGGITFIQDNSNSIGFYGNGQVSNGTLITNTMIDGVMYYGNGETQIYFYSNSQVAVGALAEPIIHSNMAFGGYIGYYPDGDVSDGFLITNQTVSEVEYARNYPISFYPNRQVRFGVLSVNQTINGITYAGGTENITSTIYYSNGQVFAGSLFSNATIDGIMYRASNRTVFHPDGQVREGLLVNAITNAHLVLASNTYALFYSNRQLHSGTISNVVKIVVSATSETNYYTGDFNRHPGSNTIGSLRQFQLAQPGSFYGTNYVKGDIITMNGDGITEISTITNVSYNGTLILSNDNDYISGTYLGSYPEQVFVESLFSRQNGENPN